MPLIHLPYVNSRDRLYSTGQHIVKDPHKRLSPELLAKLETIYKPKLPHDVAHDTRERCPKWIKGIVNFFIKHPVK